MNYDYMVEMASLAAPVFVWGFLFGSLLHLISYGVFKAFHFLKDFAL